MEEIEIKKTYYPNGQIEQEGSLKNGFWHGLCKRYYPNGKIESEDEFINGIPNGRHREWYENGKIKSEGEFINGVPHGWYRKWHENGQLKSEGEFIINGIRRGWHREWYENGVLASELCFKEGVPDGIGKQCDTKGNLLGTFEIKNGTGIEKKWYEDGTIENEISWVNGTTTGRWRMYEKDGTILGDIYWIKNRQVSKKRYLEACKTDPTLPRYEESDKAAPKIKQPVSISKSENSDELAKSILARKDVFEALKWLRDTSMPEHSLGEATTQNDSIELVESLYKAGAITVWVFDIDGGSDEEQNSGRLLIELPRNQSMRKKLFSKCAEITVEQGFDPEEDTGQKYILVMLD